MEQMRFDLGNPQEEAPKRIQKRRIPRKLKILAAVIVLVLAVVAAFILLDRTAFDGLRRSVIYAGADKDAAGCATLYRYGGDTGSRFAALDGSLVVASPGSLTLLDEKGNVRYQTGLKFSNADVRARDGWSLVYDIGGTEIYLLHAGGLAAQLTMEGEIYSAEVGAGGNFAVVYSKTGYKSAVCVYNSKGELLYEFYSADRYLLDAAVSEDGKYMACAAMSQADGSFISSVEIFRLTREEQQAACQVTGGVYEMVGLSGRFCVATENALNYVKMDGTVASYDYEGGYLRRAALTGDGYGVLLLGNYQSGGQTRLVTVNTAGEEIASMETEGEVLSLSAAGRYTAVLYSDRLVIYDRNLKECAALEEASSARVVLMRADGSAVLAGNAAASLYLP